MAGNSYVSGLVLLNGNLVTLWAPAPDGFITRENKWLRRVSMARSIFDRYGGFAKISRVVMAFYDKILDSPVTNPYFANTDMRRLIDHQTRFISSVMGGPASFTNDHLERVHARIGVTEPAFLEMTMLLRETLEDFDFAEEDIHAVLDEIMSRKNFIVTR